MNTSHKKLWSARLKDFKRDYSLESIISLFCFCLILFVYFVFQANPSIPKEKAAYISVSSAGALFLIGQIYSRLKDRRDQKRKKAQDLFYEWHSKEMKESRIYVSHWRSLKLDTFNSVMPSLSYFERESEKLYKDKYSNKESVKSEFLHEIDDPEASELHFFRIYQFFERWSLLVENNDIDNDSAREYMCSYTPWYIENFIIPWKDSEAEEEHRHIYHSLTRVIKFIPVSIRVLAPILPEDSPE